MTDDQSKRRAALDAFLRAYPDLRTMERDALGEPMIHEWLHKGPGSIIDFLARLIIEMQKRHQEIMALTEGKFQEVSRASEVEQQAPQRMTHKGPYQAPTTVQEGATRFGQARGGVFMGARPEDDD